MAGDRLMQITRAELQGDTLSVWVSGLHPTEDEHVVQIHRALLVDRKLREVVPCCTDLGSTTAIHTQVDEPNVPAYWLSRLQAAHAAADHDAWTAAVQAARADQEKAIELGAVVGPGDLIPEPGACHTTSDCTCGECDCCQAAIGVILREHFARLNPDKLHELEPEHAERLVRIGGVPGKVWCQDHAVIEDVGQHVEIVAPVVLTLNLKLPGGLKE